MAYQDDIALMAHLMRRAGFGARRDELEARCAKGYEPRVEELVHPRHSRRSMSIRCCAIIRGTVPVGSPHGNVNYMYHLVNTKRPLERKSLVLAPSVCHRQLEGGQLRSAAAADQSVRERGLGNYATCSSSSPEPTCCSGWTTTRTMGRPSTRMGRELLELFSMGVGSYTEKDVREASRAFTGWTFETKIPACLWRFPWKFEYRAEDHDDARRSFSPSWALERRRHHQHRCGTTGLCRLRVRHLYNFFVADEPQVPAWSIDPARDPKAIDT